MKGECVILARMMVQHKEDAYASLPEMEQLVSSWMGENEGKFLQLEPYKRDVWWCREKEAWFADVFLLVDLLEEMEVTIKGCGQ